MNDERNKKWIEQVLKRLSFVKWDRYLSPSKFTITIYGWIERQTDSYKDFVILEFVFSNESKPPRVYFLGTSSQKYGKRIAQILGSGYVDCKRIENNFAVKNCVKKKLTED